MRTVKFRTIAIVLATAALAITAACSRKDEGAPAGKADATGDSTGFTDKQVSLGGTCAATGNLASFQTVCAAAAAYFKYVNEELGGVKMADGKTRQIKYTWYDDSYSPPKTLEQTKRLVENDKVAAMFGLLGTATNLAARDYLNNQKVPQLFVASGAPTFGFDMNKFPWTLSGQVSYSLEGAVYGDFVKAQNPKATVAVIYQNDDFGKSLLGSFKNAIAGSGVKVVAEENYEATTASVASQVTTLAASKADYLLVFTIPKFAIQTLQTAHQLGWKTTVVLNSICASIKGILEPAGLETAQGAYSGVYLMDPTNPAYADNDDIKLYRQIARKHGGANLNADDAQSLVGFVFGQLIAATLERTKQPTRAALMEAALHIDHVRIKGFIPGMEVTSNGSQDPFPLESMQIQRFKDKFWVPVGERITSYEGKTPKPGP